MKFTTERAHLLKSLAHVHRVVERRNTIPILSNVLLHADQDLLTIRATDLDLEILETIPAQVDTPGATTVPAHMIHDIVRKLPDGSAIIIEGTTEEGVTLRSGRSRFNLQCLPESDFPDITIGEFPHHFALEAATLKHLIERTQFAISTEETRYYLNGIYLHCIEEGAHSLCAVATDGHRLAKTKVPAPSKSEAMPGIIIPRKAVSEISKLVNDVEGTINIDVSDSKIRFTFETITLTTKLIDGTFPDYSRVIPQNNSKKLKVDRAIFAAAVDRVSTVASERGRAVKLNLSKDQLILTVNNPDSGSAVEEISADYESDALEIGFNARYLLDITGQLTTDHALFSLEDSGSPTLIEDDHQDADTLYVLMPMRV